MRHLRSPDPHQGADTVRLLLARHTQALRNCASPSKLCWLSTSLPGLVCICPHRSWNIAALVATGLLRICLDHKGIRAHALIPLMSTHHAKTDQGQLPTQHSQHLGLLCRVDGVMACVLGGGLTKRVVSFTP